jgi:hypothetical protein
MHAFRARWVVLSYGLHVNYLQRAVSESTRVTRTNYKTLVLTLGSVSTTLRIYSSIRT